MLNSTRLDRTATSLIAKNKSRRDFLRGRRHRHLPFQPSRRPRPRRSRRAPLRMDRPRHGSNRRLGHTPPVRQPVVRKAHPLLLGRSARFRPALTRGVGRAFAIGHRRPRRGPRHRLARKETLRLRAGESKRRPRLRDKPCPTRAHDLFREPGSDRFRARRHSRHAFQRFDCPGDGRRRKLSPPSGRVAQRQRCFDSQSKTLRRNSRHLRRVPWPRRPSQRPRSSDSRRRSHRHLGARHQATPRGALPRASDCDRGVLRGRPALVRNLRPPQSRFPPHIYFSA